jgi:hypothetical protein
MKMKTKEYIYYKALSETGMCTKVKLRPNRIKDISGNRYGKLVVIKRDVKKSKPTYWLCKCDCGTIKSIRGSHLKAGKISSCGCSQYQNIHGKCNSREYNSWGTMIQRCTNHGNPNYKNYGARGISVCKRWYDFTAFYQDMGKRPPNTSLERKNNNLGYYPSNCVWATRNEQNRNTRLRKTNKTGYKGVSWSRERRKFVSQISVNGKTIALGRFKKIEDAINARKNAEIEHWGRNV